MGSLTRHAVCARIILKLYITKQQAAFNQIQAKIRQVTLCRNNFTSLKIDDQNRVTLKCENNHLLFFSTNVVILKNSTTYCCGSRHEEYIIWCGEVHTNPDLVVINIVMRHRLNIRFAFSINLYPYETFKRR